MNIPKLAVPSVKSYVTISPLDLQTLLKKNEKTVVIDVREDDFTGGHVKGAVHIPYPQFAGQVDTIISKYGDFSNIVFVCMFGKLRGPSSALDLGQKLKAAKKPANVYVLAGGIKELVRSCDQKAEFFEDFEEAKWPGGEHILTQDIHSVRSARE